MLSGEEIITDFAQYSPDNSPKAGSPLSWGSCRCILPHFQGVPLVPPSQRPADTPMRRIQYRAPCGYVSSKLPQ